MNKAEKSPFLSYTSPTCFIWFLYILKNTNIELGKEFKAKKKTGRNESHKMCDWIRL